MSTSEADRLLALKAYEILDTQPEEAFDRLTQMASSLFGAPIALVSLVDEDRQWFKSRTGLDAAQTPRSISFCDHAIRSGEEVMVVEDAACDPRFADNPLVTGDPGIRFYAGAVLSNPAGHKLGTLCVIDRQPRPRPTEADLARLSLLAKIAVDNLELRRVNREAVERRRLLDLAASLAGIGHWRFRIADDTIIWSDEIYTIYGVDRATFVPSVDAVRKLHHPVDGPAVGALMVKAIAEKSAFEQPFRLFHPDGALRSIVTKAVCEIDESGKVVALFGVMQDVTERDAALRRVRRSEARFRLLADNMGDVVSRIRPDGSGDYISPGIEQLLGYTPAEMMGRPAQDFVLEEDRPLVMTALSALAAGLERKSIQIRAVHKSGALVWVETNFRRVRSSEAGAGVETVAVIRDITERKALESQLMEARDNAEKAAAIKSEFLANMSHELRTPLTSILGFSKLLQADPSLGPDAARNVARVVGAGRALLATINDVLDFSKLEAGLVALDPQPISPLTLGRESLDLFEPQADAKGLVLRLEAADGLPDAILADCDRLRQILLNLVGNAVKFTPQGAVTLRLSYNAARLTAQVVDTGPGIPADLQHRLFQRFSQVDGSTTRNHGGSGLGLAICKGLAEAMGGSIGVRSRPGEGSTFWFEVPAPRAIAFAPARPAQGEAAPPFRPGARLLVVDDNFANRELVRVILAPYAIEVTEAQTGREAVDLAASVPFDLILMDLRMPQMDGPTATRIIRGGEGPNRAVPILAFTADADDPGGLVAGAGFSDRVIKPIEPSALLKALSDWLNVAEVSARAAG